MLKRLNTRYFKGRPSNDLADAGVLVHVLDGGLNWERPWEDGGTGFLSASLFNARKLPHGLYHGGIAYVLAPGSQIRCAYPQDSGTRSWTAAKATTYQGHKMPGCGPRMCTRGDEPFPEPRHDRGYACAFPPNMFKDCLAVFDNYTTEVTAYTEVVVDLKAFAVEAVVGTSEAAHYVHRALLAQFNLTEQQLPILEFGPGLKGSGPLLVSP